MAFFTLLNQVVVLFILMSAGYVLRKTGIIRDSGVSDMNRLLCYFVSPAVILYSFQAGFSPILLKGLIISLGSAICIHIFAIAVCAAVFNRSSVPSKEKRSVLRFAGIYSNCGTMGIPLLQAAAGMQGVFYGAAYIAVFNLFNWTHGISLYKGKMDAKSITMAFLNPNVIAVAVGVTCFCLQVKYPAPLLSSLKYVYGMNLALGMIVIGTQITKINPLTIFTERSVYAGMLMRNIAMPTVLIFALHMCGISGKLLLSCILPAACPVASNTVLLAELCGLDTRFPAKLLTFSTLLSIVTIPLIIYFVTRFGL